MQQVNPNYEIKEPKITLQFNQEEANIFSYCTAEEQAYFKSKLHETFEKDKKEFFSSSANKKKIE
jgi:hypothetical protein